MALTFLILSCGAQSEGWDLSFWFLLLLCGSALPTFITQPSLSPNLIFLFLFDVLKSWACFFGLVPLWQFTKRGAISLFEKEACFLFL